MKHMIVVLFLFSPLYAFTGLPTSLQNLTPGGPNANIQLAVSNNGQAMAVWTNFPNQIELQAAFFNGSVWVYLDNSTLTDFTIPGFFSTVFNFGTFAFGSSPKVGIDQNGNATIVWVSPNSQIIAARYSGNILSNVTQLTVAGTSNISPTLAVNNNGVAVVVWIQAASYQVLARSFNAAPGGGWGDTVTFMPIPQGNAQGIPANSVGTYPAAFGLSSSQGTMVWIDGPTGNVWSGNFAIP